MLKKTINSTLFLSIFFLNFSALAGNDSEINDNLKGVLRKFSMQSCEEEDSEGAQIDNSGINFGGDDLAADLDWTVSEELYTDDISPPISSEEPEGNSDANGVQAEEPQPGCNCMIL